MSIRRYVELLLDKNSAKRVEQGTKEALDKGTDPKNAEKNLGRVGGALERLRGAAKKLALAFGIAFAVRKIQQFGKESVRIAIESEAVWNRLEGQLAAVGVRYADVRAEIDATARAMQDRTTVGDEDFAAVLTELVGITGDYSRSLREVQTVADLAAAKQIDLRTSAQLVGRVMVGETGTLSRYGIIVEEGADAMEVLRARFRGMAANEARDLEGRLAQLNNEWSDFRQAVGDAMIEAGGGTSVIETLIGTVKGATIWVNENRLAIAGWGRVGIRTVRAVAETFRFLGRIVTNAFEAAGSSIALFVNELTDTWKRTFNSLLDVANKVPGIDIDFRFGGLTPEAFAQQQLEIQEGIEENAANMADALGDLAEAYRDVGTAAVEAAKGQAQSARGGEGNVNVSTGPAALDIASPGDRELGLSFALVGDVDRDPLGTVLNPNRARAAREAMDAQMELMQRRAQTTADGMASAFDGFFDAMARGFDGVEGVWGAAAELARGVGQSIIAGLAEGYSDYHMAQGAGKLAEGTWPPNPAAIAAATQHFAAAALFRALPALAGAAAGGGSGGPGVGRAPSVGALGTSRPGVRELPGTVVNVYVDPLTPSDPRFQRVVQGAVQNAQDRYGENVRVNIHSRSS